jgi:site-specific DNA recombinase
MLVPWRKTPSKRPREIILTAGASSHLDSRPIRAETRARLITAIAKGRRWLDELIAGTVTNSLASPPTGHATYAAMRPLNQPIVL